MHMRVTLGQLRRIIINEVRRFNRASVSQHKLAEGPMDMANMSEREQSLLQQFIDVLDFLDACDDDDPRAYGAEIELDDILVELEDRFGYTTADFQALLPLHPLASLYVTRLHGSD